MPVAACSGHSSWNVECDGEVVARVFAEVVDDGRARPSASCVTVTCGDGHQM